MPVFKGLGSGDIYSQYYNIPYKILSFYIINPNVGDKPSVTVYIQDADGNNFPITALKFKLNDGQAYIRDTITKVKKNERIYIKSTLDIYYYFSIE